MGHVRYFVQHLVDLARQYADLVFVFEGEALVKLGIGVALDKPGDFQHRERDGAEDHDPPEAEKQAQEDQDNDAGDQQPCQIGVDFIERDCADHQPAGVGNFLEEDHMVAAIELPDRTVLQVPGAQGVQKVI